MNPRFSSAAFSTSLSDSADEVVAQRRALHRPSDAPRLADLLTQGFDFAVTFGGQGADWLSTLRELDHEGSIAGVVQSLTTASDGLLQPVGGELAAALPWPFAPHAWLSAPQPPSLGLHAAYAVPGVLLAQLLCLDLLTADGLDLAHLSPVRTVGHSQGILGVAALAARRDASPPAGQDFAATHAPGNLVHLDAEIVAIARLIGAAATLTARRVGLNSASLEEAPDHDGGSGAQLQPTKAMIAVTGVTVGEIEEVLASLQTGQPQGEDSGPEVVIAAINAPRRVVLSGTAAGLERFAGVCEQRAADDTAARQAKRRGGRSFAPRFDELPVAIGFHHPALAPAVDLVGHWASSCGLDEGLARHLAHAICVEPVDWPTSLAGTDAQFVVDVGPGDLNAKMTSRALRGRGITVIAAATPTGRDQLFSVGTPTPVAADYSLYAPELIQCGDRQLVDTAFTRLTNKSPILLAGMTPTTVDPAIVAAAANRGHWAEWAGGGQVTEQIFSSNLARLTDLLDEGATAQFNALYLDPYLWKLHVGGHRLVQKARAAGAPLDGVVVSAGIPEHDDAVALVHELATAGFGYVAFKPGTVAQIKQVIAIARDVSTPLIAHVEGGVAGGHHSWEDLDELLLATYADLRAPDVDNLVLCVGGGIGTPERAVHYLRGTWAVAHGEVAMPVDGVLIGTAAMATLEATTSSAVKDLLVSTPGLSPQNNGGWVGAGLPAGAVTSGRSQLGADIHEIDNAASRCGALLDSVAGDAEAVAAKRADIIAAMATTAKPYFGDLATLTYAQLLGRYLDLVVTTPTDETDPGSIWPDRAAYTRFVELLDRALARVHPHDSGDIERPYDRPESDPRAAVNTLVKAHPEAATCALHPADVAHFVATCRLPGKPVPFVPVIDADVRRWWRSDSLWQAHDERFTADQVIVIPGPVSVAGIIERDEPVADLLDRFEAAVVDSLRNEHVAALPRFSRAGATPQEVLLNSSDVLWAGRVVTNPLHRISHLAQRFSLTSSDERPTQVSAHIQLSSSVPAGESVTVEFDLAPTTAGGLPRLSDHAATQAMSALLAITAGGSLPPLDGEGVATWTATMSRDQVADHAGVTAADDFASRSDRVPDAVFGLAWPAIFAVVGAHVAEGLLDLVHLDHRVAVQEPWGDLDKDVQIQARCTGLARTPAGTVLSVHVDYSGDGTLLLAAEERFLVRGRAGTDAFSAPAELTGQQRERTCVGRYRLHAPHDMSAFASASGDHNPLHTDAVAAALAGFDAPIVHGMWTSAVAQRAALAAASGGAITAWVARWVAPVRLGADIEITVDRVAVAAGGRVMEVTVRSDGELAMSAQADISAPSTVYAFPGQGIQHPGMGLDAYARSKAAREVWERADAHTRSQLGFSILSVVRDNPATVWADGEPHHHADGVLYLTQFTQVAMATLAVAQVAELREQGVFVEGSITCGHSVGEYNALAAVTGILSLETLLEIVFRRGMSMHHLIERDSTGRSNFRLAAIRPSQIDIADDDVAAYVGEVAERCSEFLQIVNYNLRGAQYAVAGTVAGLAALEKDIEGRRAKLGAKPAFILVPGIDVPFHSRQLYAGVAEFRQRLEALLPDRIDAGLLVGRYIPNLVPKLFSLTRSYIEEVADYVDAPALDEVLADFDTWSADPDRLARLLLTELLAWQFASPVRWIETQDLLFDELGVEQFVEVGVASAPTLANLATQTVKLGRASGSATPRILNVGRDAAVVFAKDVPPVPDFEAADLEDDSSVSEVIGSDSESNPETAPRAERKGEAGGTQDAGDLSFTAASATAVLTALRAKVRPSQIGEADTIEALCDGVSSRRNQLLVDLGAELGLGAIDGAAEAAWSALGDTVDKLARTYSAFGPVLGEAVADQLRKFAGSHGVKPAAIAQRVTGAWQLGPGWVFHVQAALSIATREGASLRGGELREITAESLDAAIDQAVALVADQHGISVSLPVAPAAVTFDAGALAGATAGLTKALTSSATHLLSQLNPPEHLARSEASSSTQSSLEADLAALMDAELGPDWARKVAPRFDAARAVLLDDRWASIREDFARVWAGDTVARHRSYLGLDEAAQRQATWWLARARHEQRSTETSFYGRVLSQSDAPLTWSGDTAIVTGAAPGSIAAAVVADLLQGGATVVATTSSLDNERLEFFKALYRDHASVGAALWALPANLASFADLDALVSWVGAPVVEEAGGRRTVIRPPLTPTLLFPFAAPSVAGTAADAGPRAEVEFRVLVWGVERLVTSLAELQAHNHAVHPSARRLHVVLPGSPNRGRFGGDGAYGEAKAAFDAFVQRWHAEHDWADRVSLAHAQIGWVRGTGLMGRNDPLVGAVEAAGVQTFNTAEMAEALLELCTSQQRLSAVEKPLLADLTGGLGEVELDLAGLARGLKSAPDPSAALAPVPEPDTTLAATAPSSVRAASLSQDPSSLPVVALTHPPGWRTAQPSAAWAELDVDPADLVVIVGAGEVGPLGSARTRLEIEVDNALSAAGVIELAWVTGRITWESNPVAGWADASTGELLTEAQVVDRFADAIEASIGIREFSDDGAMVDGSAPLMVEVFLDTDTTFTVASEAEAEAFAAADPEHTRISAAPGSGEDGSEAAREWSVTRLAGGHLRVPRRFKLTRFVGAQIPDGFDPARWGLGSMTESADRLAAWNLVATIDAFVSAGVSPAELLTWVHPTQLANTQGTGIGGMESTRKMYVDALLGEAPPNDILQEALPNVVAAHTAQAYLGGYGSMVHPVAACATAAVSVEEGVDKIRLGKATVVVAGGFDDLGVEGILGFGNMSATADTAALLDRGIDKRHVSRPNDRRRAGFVEGQGGGTVVLVRGDLAAEHGLPVLGVVAYAGSFADGIHTSIPAPGIGALSAGIGGVSSPLARGLAALGLGADDVAVVSKHDTSTAANDPNESHLHEMLAEAIGRTSGAPLYVISQKSLTGHAKGGAAAFQLNGLCQVLSTGWVPANRSLDCVDEALAAHEHLVWLREPLAQPVIKAGLLTSLGFGHVSAMIAVVHPGAFVATLPPECRQSYLRAASARLVAGQSRFSDAMHGGAPLFVKAERRRFADADLDQTRADEAAMLLDPTSRLSAHGSYLSKAK